MVQFAGGPVKVGGAVNREVGAFLEVLPEQPGGDKNLRKCDKRVRRREQLVEQPTATSTTEESS